jgi:modulator of FtsH protease HflC
MKKISLPILLIGGFALLTLISSSLFVVPQTVQAVVMQFGAFVREEKDPGLHWKIPFVQDVIFFEKRILDLDPPLTPVLLSDQLRINIDVYARYRINDPFKFLISARNEDGLNNRLGPTINNKMRNELSKVTLTDLLSEQRADIMQAIKQSMIEDAKNFGIEIVDIRIGRSELPDEVSASTFARMKADREQRAKQARAQGAEKATQIRATADKERTVLLAEANKQAQILTGEGDAARTKILANAYGRDQKFFELYRTLEAYRDALGNGDTTMVLTPESDFMRFMKGY